MKICIHIFFLLGFSLLMSHQIKGQLKADFVTQPHPAPLQLTAATKARNVHLMDSLSSKAVRKPFKPQRATIRSAIIPGWGQIYNKSYWKLPIVYGALGVSTGVFFSNLKTYNRLRDAVRLRGDDDPLNDTLIGPDLRPLSTQSLTVYRNSFRQYVDYSVLAFLVLWGLNVVDATVDGHLKGFDVSPNLSMKIKPLYKYQYSRSEIGIALTFEKRHRLLPLPK